MQQFTLIVVIVALCTAAGLLTDVFFTGQNIINILTQATMAGIAGLGACMLLLIGEIDLSIGSMLALIGVASVYVCNATGSVLLAVLVALVLGVLVCVISATIVIKLKVSAFITTLAMLSIVRGTVMILTEAKSIQNDVTSFGFIGTGYVLGIPFPIIVLAILIAIVYFILNWTKFGREIYAVGSNKDAAALSGVNVKKTKYLVFILNGVFVAIAAIIMASRLNSGQPSSGSGFELTVISATILGGVSMNGGRGKLSGALLGILILQILSNALVLLNVSSFYQQIARGIILILAVFFDEKKKDSINKSLLQEAAKHE